MRASSFLEEVFTFHKRIHSTFWSQTLTIFFLSTHQHTSSPFHLFTQLFQRTLKGPYAFPQMHFNVLDHSFKLMAQQYTHLNLKKRYSTSKQNSLVVDSKEGMCVTQKYPNSHHDSVELIKKLKFHFWDLKDDCSWSWILF